MINYQWRKKPLRAMTFAERNFKSGPYTAGGGGATAPLEKTIFTFFRMSLLIMDIWDYNYLDIWDFWHIGLTAPLVKKSYVRPCLKYLV
jgi:hypothetical protein